jgi:hypothetical protein
MIVLSAQSSTKSSLFCTVCRAGYGAPQGQNRCLLCPLGTYNPGRLQQTPIFCMLQPWQQSDRFHVLHASTHLGSEQPLFVFCMLPRGPSVGHVLFWFSMDRQKNEGQMNACMAHIFVSLHWSYDQSAVSIGKGMLNKQAECPLGPPAWHKTSLNLSY